MIARHFNIFPCRNSLFRHRVPYKNYFIKQEQLYIRIYRSTRFTLNCPVQVSFRFRNYVPISIFCDLLYIVFLNCFFFSSFCDNFTNYLGIARKLWILFPDTEKLYKSSTARCVGKSIALSGRIISKAPGQFSPTTPRGAGRLGPRNTDCDSDAPETGSRSLRCKGREFF